MKRTLLLSIGFFSLINIFLAEKGQVCAQESLLSLLKNPIKKADQLYEEKNFQEALEYYLKGEDKGNSLETRLRLARCFYYTNQPKKAVSRYEKLDSQQGDFPDEDMFLYAESLTASHQYEKAITWYTKYHAKTNDEIVEKKIWQLKNREFLYEDSVHYFINPLPMINTKANEMAGVGYANSLVFISNRKNVINDTAGQLYYKTYVSEMHLDSLGKNVIVKYDKPKYFATTLKVEFHEGPVSFYDKQHRVVYTATGNASTADETKLNLALQFAEKVNGVWQMTEPFPYNSTQYTITDPAITEDGKTLYFSSDMKGGFGGRDLYYSTRKDNQWTVPQNLGEKINTKGDETFPFLASNGTLYFASTGHPGLGGMDIFKAIYMHGEFIEPTNMGYPINTNFDDFALTLDSTLYNGYITSNREGSDDIYSLTIDLQRYPLTIHGTLKYKEENWREGSELRVLPEAQMILIDNNQNEIVYTTQSHADGKFSLTIPYFSQYRIKVLDTQTQEPIFVSLDLSRSRNSGSEYEIVVVRNALKD